MKDYYKINEIARLYGIGVDSLRYYEKLGILKPRRDTNGYRLYNLKDMYKLNVIRDLRRLDFSMQQIKDYLEGQTVDHTLALLRQEQALVQAQIQELQNQGPPAPKADCRPDGGPEHCPRRHHPPHPPPAPLRPVQRPHHPG